jgi:hypothetical protein
MGQRLDAALGDCPGGCKLKIVRRNSVTADHARAWREGKGVNDAET